MAGDAPYHLVIQDDAIPCPGFVEKVETLCDRLGDRLAMLFYRHKSRKAGWGPVIDEAVKGRDFVMRGKLLGPAVIYPTDRLEDCIAACDAMPDRLGSDDRIKEWARTRLDTLVTIPSLVDHRDGVSLVGHPFRRNAWRIAS